MRESTMSSPLTGAHRPLTRARSSFSHRLIGFGFAVAAVGNAVGTLPQARPFLEWCRDSAWLPPYRWVLEQLVDVAPVVVVATVVFEAVVAAMLISRRRVDVALALATVWVIGLIPAMAWPYWLANVVMAVVFGLLWFQQRRSCSTRRSVGRVTGELR